MPDPSALPTATEQRAEDATREPPGRARLISTPRAADLHAAYRTRILDLEVENDRLRAQLQTTARKLAQLTALLAETKADYMRARHLGD